MGSRSGVDYKGRPWPVHQLDFGPRALRARIWTIFHVSGSDFGHGFPSVDAFRRIVSRPLDAWGKNRSHETVTSSKAEPWAPSSGLNVGDRNPGRPRTAPVIDRLPPRHAQLTFALLWTASLARQGRPGSRSIAIARTHAQHPQRPASIRMPSCATTHLPAQVYPPSLLRRRHLGAPTRPSCYRQYSAHPVSSNSSPRNRRHNDTRPDTDATTANQEIQTECGQGLQIVRRTCCRCPCAKGCSPVSAAGAAGIAHDLWRRRPPAPGKGPSCGVCSFPFCWRSSPTQRAVVDAIGPSNQTPHTHACAF